MTNLPLPPPADPTEPAPPSSPLPFTRWQHVRYAWWRVRHGALALAAWPVRRLTAWAWRSEINVSEGTAMLRSLHLTPGAMEAEIKARPELSRYLAHCFAEIIADAPNYVEMQFTPGIVEHRGQWRWLTVTVQRHDGQTPHQLRQQAERERDAALARLHELETRGADARPADLLL